MRKLCSMIAMALLVAAAPLSPVGANGSPMEKLSSIRVVFDMIQRCQTVADDTARLACYDSTADYLASLTETSSGACTEATIQALAPKLQVAVQEAVTKDPSKADWIMEQAQAIADAGSAGDIARACELTFQLAAELGVPVN